MRRKRGTARPPIQQLPERLHVLLSGSCVGTSQPYGQRTGTWGLLESKWGANVRACPHFTGGNECALITEGSDSLATTGTSLKDNVLKHAVTIHQARWCNRGSYEKNLKRIKLNGRPMRRRASVHRRNSRGVFCLRNAVAFADSSAKNCVLGRCPQIHAERLNA